MTTLTAAARASKPAPSLTELPPSPVRIRRKKPTPETVFSSSATKGRRKRRQTEEEAIAALRAREIILSRSEVNRRCHAVIQATRELYIRLERLISDASHDDFETEVAALFDKAGLSDPKNASMFGSFTFAETIRTAAELLPKLNDFIGLGAADLPALPVEPTGKRRAS